MRAAPWFGALFLLAAATGVPAAAPADRVRRRADVDRAAGPGSRRDDDGHRPDRRHRAERAAHGAGQAQRAGQGARRRRSRRRWAMRWWRRSSPTCPREASSRRRRTCAFREPSPCPRPRSSRSSTPRRAASGCTAFATSCFLGDHGGYQKSLQGGRRPAEQEWAATTVRVHAIDEYYRAAETAYAQALQEPRLSRRRDRHPCRAGRHVARAGGRSRTRPDRAPAAPARQLGRAEGVYGDPRRASAELGQLGVDAIVTATVDAIRRATARGRAVGRP